MRLTTALPLVSVTVLLALGCHDRRLGPSVTPAGGGALTNSLSEQPGRDPGASSVADKTEPRCGSTPVEEGFADVPASDPAIRYVGRFDFDNPQGPRMAFPATTIETVFEGDAIDLRLSEGAPGSSSTNTQYYSVSIDGGSPIKLRTCPEQKVYPLARNLSQGTHSVRVSKRTEASVGASEFLGFRVRQGTSLAPPERPKRLLEVVGDSITCGYGNEVSTTDPGSHPFTSANENALLAYGSLTASALEADYVAVAASGRGFVRNYGGSPGLTVPNFYDLTAPDSSGKAWDHERYEPDTIVVNLGTNDFSIGLTAAELSTMRSSYRKTYTEFLRKLRALHPRTTLVAAVGPMLSDSYPPGYQAWTSIRADVGSVVDSLTKSGDKNVYYFEFTPQVAPFGEDWHPTVATHTKMADALAAFIRKTKGG